MMRRAAVVGAVVVITALVAEAAQAPPYREEDLTFTSGEVTIAGTLTVPDGKGPFPAVVLLSGSGAQNRDSEILGFRPFKILADTLARAGIAVLRCDDRGVGGSTGTLVDATTADLADDALAAVQRLAARSEIAKGKIGLIGHSEGALSAALAASKSPDVAFLVWMAGSARRGDEVMRQQAGDLARAAGADAATVERILEQHAHLLAGIRGGVDDEELKQRVRTLARAQLALLPEAQRKMIPNPDAFIDAQMPAQLKALRSRWMRFFIDFDPVTALARVTCPVLAIFGERDMQVAPASNRPPLERALAGGGNTRVTVKVYPEANHLFQVAVTGNPSEYAALPKAFVPSLADDLVAWIRAR